MSSIDWIVLVSTLAMVVAYGLWQTRKSDDNSEDFLAGKRNLPWWTIGLSIMSTQASAITFLSTPGQAYSEGMQFVQFYFGMPIAMLFLAYFVLPIYYKLRITTAYEYLEQRFDLRMRSLTACLFLIQRGVAAAISIYAPSIIFCTVFGWDLALTNMFMALFVVAYTASGGSAAVSRTQELQMAIMLGGLILAFFLVVHALPPEIGVKEAWQLAGVTGKTQVVDTHFDWHDRYNIWSGLLGATFLFLSYFGTDQSQVGRYLSGKTLRESRFGLLFNGFVKVPMQALVLAVGVMVFVFYQFTQPPLNFNANSREKLVGTPYEVAYTRLEAQSDTLFAQKQALVKAFGTAPTEADKATVSTQLVTLEKTQNDLRYEARSLLFKVNPKAKPEELALETTNPAAYREKVDKAQKDSDYVFIKYVLAHIPRGLIGIILAMIFCASWSTTASELNALTATSVSDIFRRSLVTGRSEAYYLRASKWATVLWGVFIMIFATYADLFDNLIQAVNMIGSIFYGTILGIFFTAFFLPSVRGNAVFWAAVCSQSVIVYLFFWVDRDAYLWYNPLACFLVMGISWVLQRVIR